MTAPIRSAILGCGPRARDHAAAYAALADSMRLVACCDLQPDRLRKFQAEFGIAKGYPGLEDMLATERPEVLHVVTQPTVRVPPLEAAAAAGVRVAIVEKPMCLYPGEAARLQTVAARSGLKIVVNHQLRLFRHYLDFRRRIAAGELGEVTFIRAFCHGNILEQGTHMLDLIILLCGDVGPCAVIGQVAGGDGFGRSHRAPDTATATFVWPDGLHANLECGEWASRTPGCANRWFHCATEVLGSRGRAWATLDNGWRFWRDGMAEPLLGPASWAVDNPQGQRDLTHLAGLWARDDARLHPCRLETALLGFNALMGLLESSRRRGLIRLPAAVGDETVNEIKRALTNRQT